MAYCGSVYNAPCNLGSCYGGLTSSRMLPSYGLGSLSRSWSGLGTLSGGWSGLGSMSGGWSGLGTLSGANVASTDQLPGSEVVIQPPPSVVTIPGPILSATSEPAAVAQTTSFATSYPGLGSRALFPLNSGGALEGFGRLGYGGWRRYGQRFLPFSGWGYGSCVPCAPCGPC